MPTLPHIFLNMMSHVIIYSTIRGPFTGRSGGSGGGGGGSVQILFESLEIVLSLIRNW